MDRFQEEYTRIMAMDKIEMQEEVKRLSEDCACPSCPSYKECGERLFCILGESECIKDEKGCLCPTCLVASTLGIGISKNFYCTRGSEMDQRTKP
ncbi:MAG: DUF2769 domain-containing protein [Methanothermobacter sp.]|nr:DUF2769 domain-containing protein [Methanothermobacter sp.]